MLLYLRYYVGGNADRTNDICWEAYARQLARRGSRQEALGPPSPVSEENQQNLQQDTLKTPTRP